MRFRPVAVQQSFLARADDVIDWTRIFRIWHFSDYFVHALQVRFGPHCGLYMKELND
jgi:hypothetical protein